MKKLWLIAMAVFLVGCDSAEKISRLEQEALRQQTEIAAKTSELENNKLQLEQVHQELEVATEKNDAASTKIQELEYKINNLIADLGKDGLILPSCLIGRSIVIYTKPYADVQIFIGVVQEIKHDDKVIMYLSQTNQRTGIAFSSIVGYRIIE